MRRRFCAAFCVATAALGAAAGCGEDSENPPYGQSGAGQGAQAGNAGAGGSDGGEAGPGGDCSAGTADDECTACLKANCCMEWQTCRAEQACTVCTDCLAREQDLGSCNFTDGTCTFMSPGDPTARVLSCGLTACEIECGF